MMPLEGAIDRVERHRRARSRPDKGIVIGVSLGCRSVALDSSRNPMSLRVVECIQRIYGMKPGVLPVRERSDGMLYRSSGLQVARALDSGVLPKADSCHGLLPAGVGNRDF